MVFVVVVVAAAAAAAAVVVVVVTASLVKQKAIAQFSTEETAARTGMNASGSAQETTADDRYRTTSQMFFGPQATSAIEQKVCTVCRDSFVRLL